MKDPAPGAQTDGAMSGIWHAFRVYVMPAAVFQSVIVGGGYGTGREVVEFITRYGPAGGLAGVGIVVVFMAVILALTFETARFFASYDYRHFFKKLIGRGWVVYELLFITILTIVLAVVLSAASTLLLDTVGLPKLAGVAMIVAAVMWAVHFGAEFVERILSAWAVFVSLFLVIVLLLVLLNRGDEVARALADGEMRPGWWLSAGQFALYNVSIAPVLLYSISDIRTRSEALLSGCIAGLAGTLPALTMHLTFLGDYPAVLDESLPMFRIVSELAIPGLLAAYFVILIGTIIQTAIGVLQGLADRLDGWLQDTRGKTLSARSRAILGGATLLGSSLLSTIGIIDLVARGYGSLAWGFLAIYVIPLLTIGLWRLLRRPSGPD